MKYIGGLILALCVVIIGTDLTHAVSANVVISQLQLGATGASKQEFVELYNNSDQVVDVTDWCVTYSDYKDESQTSLVCFTRPIGVDRIELPSRSYVLLVSQTYPLISGVIGEPFLNASTDMSGARGHVKLLKADKTVVDVLAWDNKATTVPPAHPETLAALAPVAGKSIARQGSVQLQDTDNNSADFKDQIPTLHSSALIEFVASKPIIDLCQLDGVQESMPEGYGYDEAGNCEPLGSDLCANIDKVQTVLPANMLPDADGNCYQDKCTNIDGLQRDIPAGYIQLNGTCTKLEDRQILITEILPNATGSDEGAEFIELYNPHEVPVSLKGYVLAIGKAFEKLFSLTDESGSIAPKSYVTLTDSQLGFSLLNTTSGVRLVAPAGNVVSETMYVDPQEDYSWAVIDDIWQYTDNPTPANLNKATSLPLTEIPTAKNASNQAPCAAGKYRHPVTNRCRNIESDAAVLASCDEDEYRSPDTNRCRKLTSLGSAVLAPCDDGYVRNSETNRCRKILSASTQQQACARGYERNAETNRCRKQAVTAASTFKQPTSSGSTTINTLAIVVAGLAATGYGIYEWRKEISDLSMRLVAKLKTVL